MSMGAAELLSRFSWLQGDGAGHRGRVPHAWRVSQVAVGTSAAELLKADSNRVSVRFMNIGTGRAYLGPSNNVATTTGFVLYENGGSLGFDLISDVDIVMQGFSAIASAATTVCVLEIYET